MYDILCQNTPAAYMLLDANTDTYPFFTLRFNNKSSEFEVKFLICLFLFLVVMGKKGRNKKEILPSELACQVPPLQRK